MSVDIQGPATLGRGARSGRGLRVLAQLTSAAVLGGCASFTPDGGFGAVQQSTKERIGKDLHWARGDGDLDTIAKRVAELLAKPLTAEETVHHRRQVKEAADASAELARRMEQVGNFNKLQRAREQAYYANAALRLAQAEQAQRSTRERLMRLLGVWGTQTQFALPERLPDLPLSPLELPDIEQVALAQRLDVQGAKLAAEQTASNLGLTRTTRFVNVLELGVMRNSSNEAPTQRGWEA